MESKDELTLVVDSFLEAILILHLSKPVQDVQNVLLFGSYDESVCKILLSHSIHVEGQKRGEE